MDPLILGGRGCNRQCRQPQSAHGAERRITFALGVGCHDLNDLSLDTKPPKVKARMMLEMVRDINAKFGDGNPQGLVDSRESSSLNQDGDRQTILQPGQLYR